MENWKGAHPMLKQSTKRLPTAYINAAAAKNSLVVLVILLSVLAGGCTTSQVIKTPVNTTRPAANIADLHQQAVVLMQQEKWHEAVQLYENITAQQDELSGPWLNLGIAYIKSGNSELAETAFKKSIDMNSGNIEAYNQLGILYRRSGRLKEAGFIYESALKTAPDNTNIHWNLGILYDKYFPDRRKALLHYQRYQQLTGSEDAQLQRWINKLENSNQANSLAAKVIP
jgi:Tfp pilus assembly protein PilF